MMTKNNNLARVIEDYALEPVPAGKRHTWLDISWNTVGIVTTLIQLYVGAMLAFVAGIKIAMIAGLVVAVVGGTLGWGVGHIAYRTGLPSGMIARVHGFGVKGSFIASSIFGFMLIGFIAVENVLLYKGFLFYLGLEDTYQNRIITYGMLTACWILLTAYGFEAVTRVSSLLLIGFLLVLIYMMFGIVSDSGETWLNAVSFGPQFPEAVIAAYGAGTNFGKFVFCINILAGSAGALALLDADLGRYARSSSDIGIAAYLGNFALDVLMIFIGAVIMFAGMPALIEYYVTVGGLSEEAARQIAVENPDRIAAAFIVFGGFLGAFLMFAAQAKAQVLNTYSSSLSLSNCFDAAFSWRPGRLLFVILANLLSLVLLYGNILDWFHDFLVVLGILTMSFAGIMLSDYFIVRPGSKTGFDYSEQPERVNIAGVVSILLAYVLAHHLLRPFISIEIITALGVSLFVYPVLRLYLLVPGHRVHK